MESVVALFSDAKHAKTAINALQERGFNSSNLGFATSDAAVSSTLAAETGVSPASNKVSASSTIIKGMALGAVVGMACVLPIWALLAVVPIANLYVNGGITSLLFAAVGGGGMGLLFGAIEDNEDNYSKLLLKLGIPSAQAKKIDYGIKNGHVLLLASGSSERSEEASAIMRSSGAVKIEDIKVEAHH